MIRLYEVNSKLEEAIDFETGEILDEELFNECMKAEENGADYYMALYKNSMAEADALKAEKKAMAERFDSRIKAAEKITKRASEVLAQHFEGNKYESSVGKISWRSSTSTKEVDIQKFMEWGGRIEYLDYEPKVHTADILRDLRQGKEIPGYELETKNNISIK